MKRFCRKQGWTLMTVAAVLLVGAVTTVWLSGCSDESMGEALRAAAKDGVVDPVVDPSNVVNGTFTDSRNGQTYKTVKIGNQTWMAENLNYDTANGTGSWCYGPSSLSDSAVEANCVTYGRLYNWNTAMAGSSSTTDNPSKVRGVCPVGWHLPSRAEWGALAKAAGGTGDYGTGGTAGKALKSTSGWYSGNGTDTYGFSALPGGYRDTNGSFNGAGLGGHWWMATELSGGNAYRRRMGYSHDYVDEYDDGYKSLAFSVRCVAD